MLPSTGLNFAGLVNQLVSVINAAVPVLAGVALLVFFWGLVNYIYRSDDAHGRTKGRELIVGGLIGLFVLFSLWGILNLASVSLFGFSSKQTPAQTYDI